jgi:hypothetical protein
VLFPQVYKILGTEIATRQNHQTDLSRDSAEKKQIRSRILSMHCCVLLSLASLSASISSLKALLDALLMAAGRPTHGVAGASRIL